MRPLESVILLALLASCGEEPDSEDSGMGWFTRKVALEKQIEALADLGLELNPGVTEADLTAFRERAALEAKPFVGLVEVMGIDLEREPYSPICDRLWMCDFERIEDHGAYRDVVLRLEAMTGGQLGLTEVKDYVDVEEGTAWVEFDHGGQRVRWDLVVEDDWLDPDVLVRYDRLLGEAGSARRIYSNPSDYGQVAFLEALTAAEKAELDRLTRIELAPIEEQD